MNAWLRVVGSLVALLVVGLLTGCPRTAPSMRVESPEQAASSQSGPRATSSGAAAIEVRATAASDAWGPWARAVNTTETRFGITTTDPYRWMEGDHNPELDAWLEAQGERTRAYLARIPGREALLARIRELGNATETATRATLAGGKLFYFKTAAGEQLARIMVREGGKERVLADPAMVKGPGRASLDGFSPSPDGKRLAYNVSRGGGELAVIHVLDVATGKDLPDRVERGFGGLGVTWLLDGSGFFYTQKAAPARGLDPMLNSQVKLHLLGAPADKDVPVLGNGVGSAVKILPSELPIMGAPGGSRWLLAQIAGARSEARFLVAPLDKLDRTGAGNTPWQAVAEYADGVRQAAIHADRVYLLTYREASNFRIASLPLADPRVAPRIDVAEDPRASIVRFADARDALYIQKMEDGRARLLRWAWRGEPTAVDLPFDGWISDLATDATRDGVIFNEQAWTRPPAYYAYDPRTRAVAATALVTATRADFSDIIAKEVEATSSDGTLVPLSILHRNDISRDGARPTIVQGYAGYGISMTPVFSPTSLAWLERGNVIAVCHARGGSEKGHAWQLDGARGKKMNGVHDFEACAQAMIEMRLSDPRHLFAQGGSMGGVLIGRAITDRPDLFAAANIAVGMVNPLRLGAARNGTTQFAEVGDPETEEGFRDVVAMDPYQHVQAAAYPATIFTIGLNDARVSPWMSAKMAARMRAMNTRGTPIALRVDGDAGHGAGSTRDQAFAERADVWSFFLAASGDPAFAPR